MEKKEKKLNVKLTVDVQEEDGAPFSKTDQEYFGVSKRDFHQLENIVTKALLAAGDAKHGQ